MKQFRKTILIFSLMVIFLGILPLNVYAAKPQTSFEKHEPKVTRTVYKGLTYKLGVVGANNQNIVVDSWKSTDSGVVNVKRLDSKFASMKAVGKGTAHVYAYKDGRKVAVFEIIVKSSMAFSTKTPSVEKGKTKTVKATLVGKGTFKAVSADTSVCTVKVTATGNNSAAIKIKGVKPGNTTIQVTNSLTEEKIKLKVTVKKTTK